MPSARRRVGSLVSVLAIVGTLVIAAPAAAVGPPRSDDVVPNFPSLTFTAQPAAATAGVHFTQAPVVHDVDAGGNPRVGDEITIGIFAGTGTSGANLVCDAVTMLTDASGNATYTGCSIDKVGTGYRLTAQERDFPNLSAQSAPFNVGVGPASRLSFTAQPVEASAGHPFDVTVGITDAGGNVVTTGIGATIALGLAEDTIQDVSLTCSGGLSEPVATSGSGVGTATFTGCVLSDQFANGDDVQLLATATGVTGGVALAPGLSAGISLDAASEGQISGFSLSPASSVVTWGQPVTFAVSYPAAAGQEVTVQRSADGDAWTTILNATLDSAGGASFDYRPRTSALYRAVFDGSPASAVGSSSVGSVAVRLLATQSPAHSSATVLARGTTVTFSTTVRPVGTDLPAPTVTFSIWHLSSGVWKLVGTRVVTADSTGVARLPWHFVTSGEWYVRSKAHRAAAALPSGLVPNLDSASTSLARYTVR